MYQGQDLWFIDKETQQEVYVTVDTVYEDEFTFFHKGKTVKCPIKKMGNGIYTKSKKIFHLGELFCFNGKWKRYDGKVYSEKYQEKLSDLFKKRTRYYELTTSLLIESAQKAKDSKKYDIVLSFFEIALLKSAPYEISDYISELSSLYRKCNKPNAVIELYNFLNDKYGHFDFPNSFLTSLAGAYLDIGKKEKALQYADKVYGKLGGRTNKELDNLYFRINSYRD